MKKSKLLFLLFLILGTLWIAIKNNGQRSSIPFQQNEGVIFGTTFHAKYQSKQDLLPEIMQVLRSVDSSLSMFNPQSTISKINRGESSTADSMLIHIFMQAQAISQATDGAFDVTVAPLVNAWGFGFKNDILPDSITIDSIRQFVGWQKISITPDGTLQKQDPRIVIDFSAIAKGYATDRVAGILRENGVSNFMIEIGGEIVCKGMNPHGKPWSIGINKPVDDSTSTNKELEEILQFTDCAMATSGNYRNFYMQGEKKIAHTIHPQTGYPVQSNIVSSTVLAPTCAMADGFATSFMVLGLDRARQILNGHPELDAYFIYVDQDGQTRNWCTQKIKESLAQKAEQK